MNNQRKQIAIMWLTKQGFSLWIQNQSSLLTLAFTEDAVRYFDILDENKAQTEITQFITQHNLINLRIFIILSPDTVTENTYTLPVDIASTERNFLDLVPYDNVYSKLFSDDKNIHFAATNADIYTILKTTFEQKNNEIESVIPYFITGQNIFSVELAQSVSSKLDLFTKNNIVNIPTFQESNPSPQNPQSPNQKPKSTLPILLPIFAILLIILGLVVYLQMRPLPPPKKVLLPSSSPPAVTQTPPLSPSQIAPITQIASPSSQLSRSTVTITLSFSPQIALSKQNQLKDKLINSGYIKTTSRVNAQSPTKNSMYFKSNLDLKIKEDVFSLLSSSLEPIVTQEDNTIPEDIFVVITSTN